MRPVSATGRSPSRGRNRPKSSRRSRSRSRSRSPSKVPRQTINPDFLYEMGTLGSGMRSFSVRKESVQYEPVPSLQYSHREHDSKHFIHLVKETFIDRPKVYKKFVQILSQVQYTDADKLELVKRIITLFDGYPHLIQGFNGFLPSDYSIEIQDDAVVIKVFESPNSLSHIDTGHLRSCDTNALGSTLGATVNEMDGLSDDTLAYIRQVKDMYADDPQRYKQFTAILKEYHNKKVDEVETMHKIVSLFYKYPHLIVGFNAFLPKGFFIQDHTHTYDIGYPGTNEGEVTVVNFKKRY